MENWVCRRSCKNLQFASSKRQNHLALKLLKVNSKLRKQSFFIQFDAFHGNSNGKKDENILGHCVWTNLICNNCIPLNMGWSKVAFLTRDNPTIRIRVMTWNQGNYFRVIDNKTVKGQLNSELINEVIVSSKIPTKNYRDFCPTF